MIGGGICSELKYGRSGKRAWDGHITSSYAHLRLTHPKARGYMPGSEAGHISWQNKYLLPDRMTGDIILNEKLSM